jgi:hypothetical protein
MQICSQCHAVSPDTALSCVQCGADLREFSSRAMALKRYRENPRVKAVRVATAADACPACLNVAGTYAKDEVPTLPVEGCSHENGCRCTYEPLYDLPLFTPG